MLQQDEPDDYVIGTGESHQVKEFLVKAFDYAGVELEFKGKGLDEKGIVKSVDKKWEDVLKPGDIVIEIDPRYFRPNEVEWLQADITKARQKLGWEPKVTFYELIKIMVDYDLKLAGLEPIGEGIKINLTKGFSYTNHEYTFSLKVRY
jgi:GDPmannose 4,6-dehydratase